MTQLPPFTFPYFAATGLWDQSVVPRVEQCKYLSRLHINQLIESRLLSLIHNFRFLPSTHKTNADTSYSRGFQTAARGSDATREEIIILDSLFPFLSRRVYCVQVID
jgi:hypothetical protein